MQRPVGLRALLALMEVHRWKFQLTTKLNAQSGIQVKINVWDMCVEQIRVSVCHKRKKKRANPWKIVIGIYEVSKVATFAASHLCWIFLLCPKKEEMFLWC